MQISGSVQGAAPPCEHRGCGALLCNCRSWDQAWHMVILQWAHSVLPSPYPRPPAAPRACHWHSVGAAAPAQGLLKHRETCHTSAVAVPIRQVSPRRLVVVTHTAPRSDTEALWQDKNLTDRLYLEYGDICRLLPVEKCGQPICGPDIFISVRHNTQLAGSNTKVNPETRGAF